MKVLRITNSQSPSKRQSERQRPHLDQQFLVHLALMFPILQHTRTSTLLKCGFSRLSTLDQFCFVAGFSTRNTTLILFALFACSPFACNSKFLTPRLRKFALDLQGGSWSMKSEKLFSLSLMSLLICGCSITAYTTSMTLVGFLHALSQSMHSSTLPTASKKWAWFGAIGCFRWNGTVVPCSPQFGVAISHMHQLIATLLRMHN
jgi:hypothetical protein